MGPIDWGSSWSDGIGSMKQDRVGAELQMDYELLPWPCSLVSAFIRKGQKRSKSLMGIDGALGTVDTDS